jgi:hypothetical protein
MGGPDLHLETLLDLDCSILEQAGGYWIRIEARRVPASEHARNGMRSSLTLRDKCGTRVLGYGNAHAVKLSNQFKFVGRRLPYDHRHRTASDKSLPYVFESSRRLLEDFFVEVDRVIKEAQQ